MKVYNTLNRQKEEFQTVQKDTALIYVCGPTVYNYIHVGNARPMVIFDTLRRYLLYKGLDVKYVVNFTDVDDKIINQAKADQVAIGDITEKYIRAFLEDSKGLNILEEKTIHPRATEYIYKMIDFISDLEKKGAAYNVNGNVYFDINKTKDYGKLSKKNIEDLQAGARIDVSKEKKNPMDFALWKKRKDDSEPAWESPWGLGRPGWHIECSVMAKSLLGDTIDIHAGGEDLQFPHHENEIAQSETRSGKPFANYWMHNSMINIDNQKMSKSLGNFFTLRDIAKEYDLEVVRLWLLSAHYRNPINFSRDVMDQNKSGLERLYNGKSNMERLLEVAETRPLSGEEENLIKEFEKVKISFETAMDDDLNTADAVSSLYDLIRLTNSHLSENSSRQVVQTAYDTTIKLANVLGLLYKKEERLEGEIEKLIEERTLAKKAKDFKKADAIRDQLKEMGIELKDTRTGVIWTRFK